MALIRATGYVIGNGAIGTNNLTAGSISLAKLSNTATSVAKITSITYPNGNTANSTSYPSGANTTTAGGQTITITGSGFATGMSVFVLKTQSSVVSVTNSTSMTFRTPAMTAGRYTVFAVKADGSVATFAPGIVYA